jgi:hypothetical protein
MSTNDQVKKISKKMGQGFDLAEMKMEELARLVVTMSPDHEKYEGIVNEIKLRTEGKNTFNGVTKGVPAKGSFRRAPGEEIVDAEVPSTRGADVVRLMREADPGSPEYTAYTDFLKAHTRRVELEKSRKGNMVERIGVDEDLPPPLEHQKPISEQILGLGVFLPASELGLKRDIIRLGMKVKEMEDREAQIKKLFSCAAR